MPDVPEGTTCNLFDDHHLEKHVLLIQPWVNGVKSKRSVYVQLHWMYARSAGLGYPYYHVSHFTTATSTTTIVSFYFWLTASGKNLEHAQNAKSDWMYTCTINATINRMISGSQYDYGKPD
jgi:hypothetical protein